MEEAAASLGAGRMTVFRKIVMPNLGPAIFAGAALAFARAVGEFGSVVLIAGTAPDQQTAPIYIFTLIEYGNETGAAAVSVVLLGISLAILLLIGFFGRRAFKHAG
jgi:sulfate transport system permease protein